MTFLEDLIQSNSTELKYIALPTSVLWVNSQSKF